MNMAAMAGNRIAKAREAVHAVGVRGAGHRHRQRIAALECLEDRALLSFDLLSATPKFVADLSEAKSARIEAIPAGLRGVVDPELWHVAQMVETNPATVPSMSAVVDASGAIETYIHLEPWSEEVVVRLAELGVEIQYAVASMNVVQARVHPADFEEVVGLGGVSRLSLPTYGSYSTGWVNTAGDAIHRSNVVRERFAGMGIDGTGVRVGVISNGMANAWRVMATGDLPGNVVVGSMGVEDEGTAMLEIVHDIAPEASLYFYGLGSSPSSAGMVTAINWLVAAGVDVIVDDVYFLGEPYFTDGPIAMAARSAVTNYGITYITSAGNHATPGNQPGGSDRFHYQKGFEDYSFNFFHEWSGWDEINTVIVPPGVQFAAFLQWSDPWNGSANDYDLLLYDNAGNVLWNNSGIRLQSGSWSHQPWEVASFVNPYPWTVTVHLAVYRTLFASYRELEMFVSFGNGVGAVEYTTAGNSITGHAAVSEVITVGAVHPSDPWTVASYSNRGPSTIYTNFASQSKTLRSTLDGVAVAGVETRIGQLGYFSNPFYGTSAAAPHAAGLAALILSAAPWLTPSEVSNVLAATAVDLETSGYDHIAGAGRFDALNAVYRVYQPGAPDLLSSSDTGLSSEDNRTSDTTPTFSGTVPRGSFVQLFVNGTSVASQQLAANESTYSITVPQLADGTYTVTVRVAPSSWAPWSSYSQYSSTLSVTIDSKAPVADVLDVSPDPRAMPVDAISISFDSVVFGFDLGDLRLTRNGESNLLTGTQGLSTTDNRTFTLTNLASLTALEGTYVLTLIAAGSGITDLAGNAIALDASETWSVIIGLTVTNTHDSGLGSLRQALLDANAIPGLNVIRFEIGSGMQTIRPSTALPAIIDSVVIDGTTQPGYGGSPVIEIDGSNAGSADGLFILAGGSTIRGLVINGFGLSAIALVNASGNRIEGNYLGTDITGQAARGNQYWGLYIAAGSSQNTIGGTTLSARNVISGNGRSGIAVYHSSTTANLIVGNLIGTNAAGHAAIPNGQRGVEMAFGTSGNTVGGTAAEAGNLISGNTWEGIALFHNGTRGHLIAGNRIGTNLAGVGAIPNGTGGLWLHDGPSQVTIGGSTAGAGNLISGNARNGIALSQATTTGNLIAGNLIGTDASGDGSLGNAWRGIELSNGTNSNRITGNVLSANGWEGISLFHAGTDGNLITGNRIGTNAAATAALGNANHGIWLWGGPSQNTIGGTALGAGNVIAANGVNGVHIDGTSSSSNVLWGNFIGTDPTTSLALGNGGQGVRVVDSPNNVIGGTITGSGNVIAHQAKGIAIVGGTATGNAIRRNLIRANPGPAVDLADDGITSNDAGDADVGPNGLQNSPVLTSAVAFGTQVNVKGSLNSNPSTTFTVEFFWGPAAGVATGYLGAVSVNTNSVGNATFNINLPSNLSTGFITATATSALGNTSELAGSIAISALTASINDRFTYEGNSGTRTLLFTITLSAPAPAPTTFSYATANGTATAGSDYTAKSGTVTIPTGSSSTTLSITILGDSAIEPDETFVVNLSNAVNARILKGQGIGTIRNDDPVPTISIDDPSILEGQTGSKSVTFTVSLSAPYPHNVTVNYATANGTATAGSDYTAKSGSVTIAAGATSVSVTIAILGDLLIEPDETFVVNLSAPVNATIAKAQGVCTIQDDDIPQPTISIDDITIVEGHSGTKLAVFTVSLSSAYNAPINVNYATANGTATAGSDYTARALSTLTFNAGVTSMPISIPVIGDLLIEPDETFVVNLSAPVNATIAKAQGVCTIQDDDIPQPTISIDDITIVEGHSGTKLAVFTVSLSSAYNAPITVKYATANGTATAGSDYTALTLSTMTFNAGITSISLHIPIAGDLLVEPDETFVVNLSSPVNATIAKAQGVCTIIDDDIPQPTISITDVSIVEGHSGSKNATFTVSLSHAYPANVSVRFATANGTATAGSDYTALALTTLTFNPGVTTLPIRVTVFGDLLVEPDETFVVNLSSPVNATIAKAQGVGTILNDDVPQPTISITDVSIVEGHSGSKNATFTVSLSHAYPANVSVRFATVNGTATAGSDYTASALTTLTFNPGVTTLPISVTVFGDLRVEPDETFVVNLSSPVNATIAKAQGVGTILNDDGSALRILGSRGRSAGAAPSITDAALAPIVSAAIDRWAAVGLDPHQIDLLRATKVQVLDLPGNMLGVSGPSGVRIDGNAAGRGWYIDTTPHDDREFGRLGRSPVAARRGVDLLTVISHEFGHVLGLDDIDIRRDPLALMADHLPVGTRRVPSAAPPALGVARADSNRSLSLTRRTLAPTPVMGIQSIPEPMIPAAWRRRPAPMARS